MANWIEKAEERVESTIQKLKDALNKKNTPSASETVDADLKKKGESLVQALETMEREYEKSLFPDFAAEVPESTGTEQIEYTPPTDEELKKQAETALLPDYTEGVAKAEETYLETSGDIAADRAEATEEERIRYDDLSALLDDMRLQHQSDMIRQGLVHSTINTEGQAATERYGEQERQAIENRYKATYDALDQKAEEARLKYDNAIRSYDLKYAADLEKRIADLTAERDKQTEKINAYNQKVAEAELKYQEERQKKLAELEQKAWEDYRKNNAQRLAEAEAGRYTPEEAADRDKRLEEARSFFGEMSAEDALKLFSANNASLSDLLGVERYQTLFGELFVRAIAEGRQ